MPPSDSRSQLKRPKEPAAPKMPRSLAVARLPEHDLEDDRTYRSMAFTGIDLSSRDVEIADFEGCRLVDTGFAGTRLHRAGFVDVEFERCDLSTMAARMSTVQRGRVSSSRLTGTAWTECAFRDVLFDGCRADLARFRFSTFTGTVFRDCSMPEADFQNADLRGVRFERCDLTRAQFSQAQMGGAHFADCTLVGIGGVTSLKGAIVRSQDAQGLLYVLAGAMGITIEE
ncbi:pentapeptide repeat-containing protein [Microtetraspora malaysiensis]|uniref:pentapeptide repeat-containing protein n=1 Tax=Microtetraspora malaysiensis TaxID=161358 RepID=UPI003D8F07E2